MDIKVSIIVPVYNMEKYIQECFDSIMVQTLKEIEIICVNDGSTDNSERIIRRQSEKDDRFVLINKKNGGAASARNAALEIAKGEFVAFMDPDDWYPENDILETLYNKAKENDVLICGGSFSEISQEKGLVTEFTGARSKYSFKKDGIVYYKDYQFDYGYHRFIYNLEFLKREKIYFPPYLRYQDPPFFVKAMIAAEKFYAIKKVVYRYRVGHQKIQWNEQKLGDLLSGLKDNIEMASKAGLEELHYTTVERLGKVYKNMYATQVKSCSPDFLRQLMEVDKVINSKMLLKLEQGNKYINIIPDIIQEAMKMEDTRIKEVVEENEKLKRKCKELEECNSYRIGKVITYVPGKIKKLLKRNK